MSLLERVVEAHGGRDAWHGRERFELEASVGGVAWPLRGRRAPGAFRGRVRTDRQWMEVLDYPRAGMRGVFEPHRVRIEDSGGRLVSERGDPRAAFGGLRRQVRWDDLDLLYFAGYAWWNYLAFPFLLEEPGFELEELGGRRLRALFPEGYPTHSREQVFHFDSEHRLVRHDYTAEVFGRWARAAHLTGEHRRFDGLLVPTRRRVYPRVAGRPGPFPVIIALDITAVRALA